MTPVAAARRLLVACAILLVVPLLLAAHCQKPKPEEVADLSLSAAAEAYTAWFSREVDKAVELDPVAKATRLNELAAINRKWNAAEAGFDAAHAALRAGRGDRSAVVSAYDAAQRMLCELRIRPCGGG